jgi:hypothetical protein
VKCILELNKNPRVLVISTTVKKMNDIIERGEIEKETITNKSHDLADMLIYVSSSLFKKEYTKKTIMEKIKTKISKQFKKRTLDFPDTFEVQYRSNHTKDILEKYLMDKPKMYVMMMMTLNIDENCAVLDIPGGKRKLGETSKKAAIRETYEETCLRFNENDLEIAINRKTDVIYKVNI